MKRYFLIIFCMVVGIFHLYANPVTRVYISEILYDSPLREDNRRSPNNHNNGEYIQLYNPTSEAIDLSGWTLLGTMSYEQFIFPNGTTIAAHGSLLIAYRNFNTPDFTFSSFYNRKGSIDESKVIYQNAIILNNKGERLALLDPYQEIVDAVTFTAMSAPSNAPSVWARNRRNDQWTEIYSLHRTEVHEWEGQPVMIVNRGLVAGIATPLAAGNAQTVITNPFTPPPPPPPSPYLEGEIPAEGQVTPTGAFQYTVPIEVPAGVQGFQPQISLVYNSQSGLGLAGMGWNLIGLSVISTTQSTIYHNDETGPVPRLTKDNIHNLTLDGARLIHTGSNGNTCYFELENDNKCRVEIIFSESGQVVLHAQVFLPNGTVGIYGMRNNFSLRIAHLKDMNGNYISYTYEYSLSAQQYYISKIEYGGLGAAHVVSLQFGYEIAQGVNTNMYYISGSRYKNIRRLKHIESFVGNQRFRRYDLTYNSGYYSQLSHINVQGASGVQTDRLRPLHFTYGTGIANENPVRWDEIYLALVAQVYPNLTYENTIITSGKFIAGSNNDAIITLPKKNPYTIKGLTAGNVMLNGYSSEYAATDQLFLYPCFEHYGVYFSPLWTYTVGENFRGFLPANINGGLNRDIIMINATANGPTNARENLTLKQCAPYLNVVKTITYSLKGQSPVTPKKFLSGDFNGDGKEEIFAVEYKDDMLSYIFDLNHTANVPVFCEKPFTINENDMVFALDYDGDGKTDIGIINADGLSVYTFKKDWAKIGQPWPYSLYKIASSNAIKSSDFDVYKYYAYPYGYSEFKRQLLIGDINGDGKTDLLLTSRCASHNGWYWTYTADNFSRWTQLLSNGDGGFEVSHWVWTNAVNTDGGTFLQDMNGDGRPDIVSSEANYIYIRYADGEQFSSTVTTIPKKVNGGLVTTVDYPDLNNNRFLAHIKDNKIYRFNRPRDEQQEALLTGIYAGSGITTTLDYTRMGQSSNSVLSPFYHYDEPDFPYRELKDARLWLVQNIKTSANGQFITNNRYGYAGATVHLQGLGFCGMRQVNMHDIIRNTHSHQIFDPLRRGVLLEEKTPTQTINNVWDVQVGVVNQRKITARLMEQKLTHHLTGFMTTSSSTYNSYGLPDIVERLFGSEATEKTTYSYYNATNTANGGKWIIGFPSTENITITRDGASYSRSSNFTYNANHLLQKKNSFVNGNQTSEEEFTYNIRGLLLTQSSKAYNSTEALTITNAYTADGRFLQQRTDAAGKTITWEYDNVKGVPVKETDFKENITTYTYDAFGRLTGANYPDDTQSTRAILKAATGEGGQNTQNARTVVVETYTGKPQKKTYYDVFGREVATMVQGFDGTPVWTNKVYNDKGFLVQTSAPHFGNPSRWTNYEYDEHGRVLKVVQPSGKQTSYTYPGTSVVTLENGIEITKTRNALGEIVEVIDPAGSIQYKYRPDGQPSSIQAPDGSITAFGYDNYGRQTKITDPSAGAQTYTYDPAGNLASQTNAKGQRVSMTYNKFGQMLTKTMPEFRITYRYNADQQLIFVEATNGSSTSYTYDDLGRVLTTKEVVGNEEFEKIYTYDRGKLSTVTYSPLGETPVNYLYNTYGYLSEIKHGATDIWKLEQKNALGQKEKEILGNGVTNTYAYTIDGFPTSIENANASLYWQHKEFYNFDPVKGLLDQRRMQGGFTEDFTYDTEQQRLTGYNIGNTSSVVNYNNMGNIRSKTDVGQMTYTVPNKPYAIGQVLGDNPDIPVETQDITYTSFSRPAAIEEDGYKVEFDYNDTGERTKMNFYTMNALQFTRYYLGGNYEKEVNNNGETTAERLYIGGSPYSAPAVYSKEGGVWKLYYLHRDYLGSIRAISDEAGNKTDEYSYDPWGRLRNPATGENYNRFQQPALRFNRGYTGHEHLPWFGLINMNARLYDPILGRFLSPDPFVQAPDWSQNFNRYTYAANNPLLYVDESGEFIFTILAAVFCSPLVPAAMQLDVSWMVGGLRAATSGGNFWNGVGQGFITGLINAGVSFLNVPGMIPNGILHAGTSVLTNGLTNTLYGQSFFNGWYYQAAFGFAGGAYGGYQLVKASDGKLNYWWGNKVAYNRTQWSFWNVDKPDFRIDMRVPNVGSKYTNDCVPTTDLETETMRGGSRSYNDFAKSSGYVEGEGAKFSQASYERYMKRIHNNVIIMCDTDYELLFDHGYMQNAANRGESFTVHFRGHVDKPRYLDVYLFAPEKNTLRFRQSRYNFTSGRGSKHPILNIFNLF